MKILDIPSTMINIEEGTGQEWILDMINNILIEVLSFISENERVTILARQSEGIAAMPTDGQTGKRISKKTGRCIGRPPIQFPEHFDFYYKKWKNKEITATDAMKALELKPNSFYNLVHKYEAGHNAPQTEALT